MYNSTTSWYDLRYDEFIAAGIDEVYCISVNDGFVMNAWAKELGH